MTERDHHVDLARVIATVFVVILHVLGQGGILNAAVPHTASYWTAWYLETGAYCAVNCFALITGYVMVYKTTKLKNMLNLWFQIFFYSAAISLVFFIFSPETRTLRNLMIACLPIVGKQWWYTSSYFILLFFIPFLNTTIRHLSRHSFRKLLLVILCGICLLDCMVPLDGFVINGGYSPLWLACMYLFGAYIRKYDIKEKITAPKCLLGFFTVVTFSVILKAILKSIGGRFANFENVFISYISITITLAAVFLFLFCQKVKIGPVLQKVIAFFAPTTLSVYLIHVHPLIFRGVMKKAFESFAQMPVILMVACVFGMVSVIFVICALVDHLRIGLFRLLRIAKLSESLSDKLNAVYSKRFPDETA